MKTSLLLSSCEGNTWAFQVEDDDQVRKIVSDEMFGDSPEKEEVDEVVSILLRESECRFEDGSFRLIPGGIYATSWHPGCPDKCYGSEWFIAKLDNGEKVVLRALPEEFSYDYKTADDTYYMAIRIKCWMQFPDSEFIPYAQQIQGKE